MIPDRVTPEMKDRAQAIQAGVWIAPEKKPPDDWRERMKAALKRRKSGQEKS